MRHQDLDLRADERFRTAELRRKNLPLLLEEVQSWMRSFRSFEELEYQVSGAGGLAIGKVRTAQELLESEWAEADQPTYLSNIGDREIHLPKGPWKFNGEGTGDLSPAATRGKNNHTVLSQIGIDEATIIAWEEKGILSCAP